jgi:hypothetical protein
MRLQLKRVGPIDSIDLDLGDLTVLVGPQAIGKSIALQSLTLALDYPAIKRTLIDHGIDPTRGQDEFFADFFGEGMGGIFSEESGFLLDKKNISYSLIKGAPYRNKERAVFYIPAQRVTSFEDGWPRRFTSYSYSTPFIMRAFSEELFLYLDRSYARTEGKLFPHPKSLKSVFKKSLAATVFHGEVRLDREGGSKKRLVLIPEGSKAKLPMGIWSAGQREFTPLLLGLYKVIPNAAKDKDPSIDTVIIEEPEMGLHPRAIKDFMLVVMELLYRGYKVVISTHSPTILELLWAFKRVQQGKGGADGFCALFGVGAKKELGDLPAACLKKSIRTYYFKPGPGGAHSVDISGLDPWADADEASWGGLTEQSDRLSQIVAETSGEYGA